MMASAGLIAVASGVKEFAMSSIAAFSEFESVRTNLQIVMGDAKQATATFEELKELGARTPFSVVGLTDAATQLLQTGTAAKDLTATLRMLGDVAGGSTDKFNRIVQNYAQIQSVGKTTAMDIKQFAMAGLPIYEMLGKLGIQGNATAEEITTAFKMMAGEGGKFFNGMVIQSQTLQGKTSTLKDTWQEFQATFAENTGFGDAWKKMLDIITVQIEGVLEEMNETKENAEFLNKVKEQEVTATEMVLKLEEQIAKIKKTAGYDASAEYAGLKTSVQVLEQEKALWDSFYHLEVRANAELEERTAILKEQESLVESTNKKMEDFENRLKGDYSKTEEGKRKQLEENIAFYKDFINNPFYYEKDIFDEDSGEQGQYVLRMRTEESLEQAKTVLSDLEKEFAKLKPKDWTDYWEEVTGINAIRDKDSKELLGTQLGKRYIDKMLKEVELQLSIKDTLGLSHEKSDVIDDYIDKVESQIAELFETGEFQDNDNSIQKMKEFLNILYDMKWSFGTLAEDGDSVEKTISTLAEYANYLIEEGHSLSGNAMAGLANLLSGSEVGNFVDLLIGGNGIKDTIFNSLFSALSSVVGGLSGMQVVLNPLSDLLEEFSPLIKAVMLPIYSLVKILGKFGEGLMWVLDKITFGLIGEMADTWDELVEAQEDELSMLEKLNDQYKKLIQTIKEQEEYYLAEKKRINAESYIEKTVGVNDMILTPQGNFSTHPDDYIIATKNPNSLGGKNNVNVYVVNEMGNDAQVTVNKQQDESGEALYIKFSRKIANDVANGSNGWDNALRTREMRLAGRRISI